MKNDGYKGSAIVLSGTNYGEADKILHVLLADGRQIGVMAKAVRKSKSKLAGGTQILAINHLEIHFSANRDLAILTGSRMAAYFSNILKDFARLKMAQQLMKRVKRLGNVANPDFFRILSYALEGLNKLDLAPTVVEIWFMVNLNFIIGEIGDLHYSTDGKRLKADEKYVWDVDEKGLRPSTGGQISSNEIKFLRLILEIKPIQISNVKGHQELLAKIVNCGMIRS